VAVENRIWDIKVIPRTFRKKALIYPIDEIMQTRTLNNYSVLRNVFAK